MNGTNPRLPASLAALSLRRGVDIGTWNTAGRADLRVDNRHRIVLRPGPGTAVIVESALCRLPDGQGEREQQVDRLMLRVTALAAERASPLALDLDGGRIIVYSVLDSDDVPAFESGFERFLNDLDYWAGVVASQR